MFHRKMDSTDKIWYILPIHDSISFSLETVIKERYGHMQQFLFIIHLD